MSRRIYLRPEAEVEIRKAADWYDEHGAWLGEAFLDEVARVLEVIRDRPEQYPIVDDDIRKAVLRRFPYVLLYRARDSELVVISCFHTRRDPREWRRRLR